nr:MAG TPA: hypothetical protein [Caudoviricetes sp.]
MHCFVFLTFHLPSRSLQLHFLILLQEREHRYTLFFLHVIF